MRTVGSLFAGIGGFDLGFERAGFKTAWAVEIDQKAQSVLRLRFPDAKLHDDVREVGARNLSPVDVVTFGSPCQDLSIAGKRAGLADTPRYKQAGNAVTVNVAEWIAKNVAAVYDADKEPADG
jgi:site-specific DNA-cytosine methylase